MRLSPSRHRQLVWTVVLLLAATGTWILLGSGPLDGRRASLFVVLGVVLGVVAAALMRLGGQRER